MSTPTEPAMTVAECRVLLAGRPQDEPLETALDECGWRPKDVILRSELLRKIGDYFQAVMQDLGLGKWSWMSRSCAHAAGAERAAALLIELLEVHDCGSVGGFDRGQSPGGNLFERWDWLYRKYGEPDGQRFGSGTVTYEEIKAAMGQEEPSDE